MNRTRLLLILSTIVAGPLLATSAHAQTTDPSVISSDLKGNPAVNIYVGHVTRLRRPQVCFENRNNSRDFKLFGFGNSAGLSKSVQINGTDKDDFAQVVGGFLGTLSRCGETFVPIQYHGRNINIQLRGGNDQAQCGADRTFCSGGSGDDLIVTSTSVAFMSGGTGNDRLSGSTASTDDLRGGDGDDCIDDPGHKHRALDCGNGFDVYINGSPSNSSNCDNFGPSCLNR